VSRQTVRKVPFFVKGVMRHMSTNLVISDERSALARSRTIDSKPNRTWVKFLPLVLLILIELGGMALLCYKCEHPEAFLIFCDR
jgi:hypothetical protein